MRFYKLVKAWFIVSLGGLLVLFIYPKAVVFMLPAISFLSAIAIFLLIELVREMIRE